MLHRNYSFFVFLSGIVLILCYFLIIEKGKNHRTYSVTSKFSDIGIHKPASIIKFQEQYVVPELLNNRLAISKNDSFTQITYFDPQDLGKTFKSPHYLALSPWGSLLVSNGWGRSIIELSDLNGTGWKEFNGIGKKFNAPHGICTDRDGWIYVGDSLNSRIVRFKDMEGKDFQVFSDQKKLVSYTRQLVCRDGSVWVSNSYENREGLNPGKGGNILKIDDFSSGEADIVFAMEDTNFTGVLPLDKSMLVALWGKKKCIVEVNLDSGNYTVLANSQNELGIPYGLFLDEQRVLATYFGDFETNKGGIVVLTP